MVQFCQKCLMSNTRPRVVFDEAGVCNGCKTAEAKQSIDWDSRRAEFLSLIEEYRGVVRPYDCIVPWSGGKDSSYIAYRLKFEFGLNPLLVTFSPLIPNEVGAHNREEFLKLGFDHILVRPNQKVSRQLAQRFFIERGNPKVHWDAGINSIPLQVAVRYQIPLVFYAEHGESEYGGRVLSEEHLKIRDIAEILENQVGDDPRNWVSDEVSDLDLAPYTLPSTQELNAVGVKAMYYAYFFPWDVFQNYKMISEVMDFRTAPAGRTDGTFTDYDSLDDKVDDLYYHLQYIKFGFGRATRDASRLIQRGHITREEGLESAYKYDAEFPYSHLPDLLDYLNTDEPALYRAIDLHRNEELWVQEGNEWRLRYPPL